MYCHVVHEGVTDLAVLVKTLEAAGWPHDSILSDNKRGKANIDTALPKLANEAKTKPVIVVRDLDQDGVCASQWLQDKRYAARWLTYRIAVRSIESWFLADRKNAAHSLRVTAQQVPKSPDDEPNAKQTIIALARKSSNQSIRNLLVPRPGVSATVGPGYVLWFEKSCALWSYQKAQENSESLRRAHQAFVKLRTDYQQFLGGKG
jgi:hypothetical protein